MALNNTLMSLKSIFGKNYDFLSPSKRKESNLLFSNWLKDSIKKLRDEIAIIKNMVLQAQMIMVWGDLDKLLTSLVDISNNLNETTYEGSTFFRSQKNIPEEVDKILNTELKIVDLMKLLLSKLSEFKDSIESALLSETSKLVLEMTNILNEISKNWIKRKEIIVEFRYL
ncbi:MAG: hypothetical protein ACFFD1_02410 [Candidatus Thorarchaeota archaeon]